MAQSTNILVWGINYAPEVTGIGPCNAAMCDYLASCGHTVRMLTTFPYYPEWKPSPFQGLFKKEKLNNVWVYRCWHYVPRLTNFFHRALHELSFVIHSFVRALLLPRVDLVIVISPPLALGAAAWLLCLCKRMRYAFHVQDLQPGAALELGLVRSKLLFKALRMIEKFTYRGAAAVSGITARMLEHFQSMGVPMKRCLYFPNVIDLSGTSAMVEKGAFRRTHGIEPGVFLILYSGNLGRKQSLEVLLEVAALTKSRDMHFVICGEGNQRQRLLHLAKILHLNNVLFLPLQGPAAYRQMLMDADLCVITQAKGAGKSFFPSKLLPILAHGKPVLVSADPGSELAEATREGGFGEQVPAGDAPALFSALQTMASNVALLEKYAAAGRGYVQQFNSNDVLARYEFGLRHCFPPPRPEQSGCSSQAAAAVPRVQA